METDESNMYYCIIIKYTKAKVREVFLVFGYLYRQEQLPLILQGLVENNLHEMFVRFWYGLCIKPINSRVLGFLQSQMFFVIMFLPVCTPILQKFIFLSSFRYKQVETCFRDLDATFFLSCIGLIGPVLCLKEKNLTIFSLYLNWHHCSLLMPGNAFSDRKAS